MRVRVLCARSVSLGQERGEGPLWSQRPPSRARVTPRAHPTVPEQTPRAVPAYKMSVGKYSRQNIATRNTRENANIIIDNVVYDITNFIEDHPGGVDVLLENLGKDASKCFTDVGHSDIAIEWRKKFEIGEVVDADRWEVRKKEAYPQLETDPPSLGFILNVWGPPVVLGLFGILFYSYFLS